MSNDATMIEVSDILESFNAIEINQLISEQITLDGTDNYTDISTNHLQPLYYTYASIKNNDDVAYEVKEEAVKRYHDVCRIIMKRILEKFSIELDDVWVEENENKLPAITMGFYDFFVLNFANNLYETITSYIVRNCTKIYETFEGSKNKKDCATLVNKQKLTNEMAVIVSNIYDICIWAIDNMDEETFFEGFDPEYLPIKLIYGLYKDGKMEGEFMDKIRTILRSSLSLKSKIGFEFTSNVLNGRINDLFITNY